MTIFARSRSWLAGALPRHTHTLRLAVPLAALLTLALSSSAGALVVNVGGTEVGVQTRSAPLPGEGLGEGQPLKFANEHGNPVLHGTSVYAVYWDPGNEEEEILFHHEWVTKVDQFLQDLGNASGSLATIFAADGQYRDSTNTGAANSMVFKGSYSDTAKYPGAGCTDPKPLVLGEVTCLTDTQLQAQLQAFIARSKLPTGMGTVYYLLTPPGVTVCLDSGATHCSDYTASKAEEEAWTHKSASFASSFCSYHGDINPDAAPQGDGSTILYSAIPWTAGYQGDFSQFASSIYYARGYSCQDGGWSPEGNEERFEQPKPESEEEEKILKGEKGSADEKAKLERRRELERPHNEEPNQEAKGEFGDFSAGLADLLDNQIAVEQADIVTDPVLTSWQDPTHHEVTDLCHDNFASTAGQPVEGSVTADENTESGTLSNQTYAGHKYYINNTFSLSGRGCVGGVGLVPRFTAPDPVNSGEIVGFDGMESTVLLQEGIAYGQSGPTKTYMTFSWNFGDGSPEVKGYAPGAPLCEAPWLSPCAASTFHSYAYGGTYKVRLTITDIGGNVSDVEHELKVNGPAPPSSGTGGGSGTQTGGTTTGTQTTGASTGGAGARSAAAPVVRASIVSRNLRSVVRKGLVVRYSVNEQVAGHFEVMIGKALARRLGLSGSPATGLPAGTPPQLQIGKAVLVTTKAGNGTITIVLSKSATAHLRKAHSLALTLRLTVRNAASRTPLVATVVSAGTLG